MIELTKIKEFLRLDTDAEDMLLKTYAQAAEDYLKAACGEGVCLLDARAELVQLMLIADWFENRTMYANGTYSNNISSMIMQLQLETEVH